MKTKKEINVQVDSTQKSDKERIKALEAENARLKYEISFYDDFMNEMREIVKANRAVKKAQILILTDVCMYAGFFVFPSLTFAFMF